jgi:PleD family two-component response regulator
VAVLGPDCPTADSLLDAADEALYEAKRSGRNCVRVFHAAAV